MDSQVLWYTARAAGLVAWGLLAVGVIWGLALSTKVTRGHPRPAWILDLHRFLTGSALVFTAVHVVSISLDTYVHFGPVHLLVPFTGTWHPVAVAWGVVGMYLLVAVEVTSLLRPRLSRRVWRSTHYLAFPLFALASIHALSAGTDRADPVFRGAVFTAAAVVLALTSIRVRHAKTRTPTGHRRKAVTEPLASAR